MGWTKPPAPPIGAQLAHGYGDVAIEDIALAVCALCVIGGWNESELLTFHVTHANTASWVSARGTYEPGGWTFDVWQARRGTWQAVREQVATPKPVVLADVDWAMPYNDAYGHQMGDLMLARVHACIELAALRIGASFVRAGGEEFAVIVDDTIEKAASFAESIRGDVEAMNIPFAHPEVRTHGRVTVSVGVMLGNAQDDLQKTLEAAVDEAKRLGRNRVCTRAAGR